MALHGIRLNLALLALASSSGYLLFYLASDSSQTLLSRELARWNHFVVETPVELIVSETAATTESKPINPPSPPIVLSGHGNSATTCFVRFKRNDPTPAVQNAFYSIGIVGAVLYILYSWRGRR